MICLRSLTYSDNVQLFSLIQQNKDHLRLWLPWVDKTNKQIDTENFLRTILKLQDSEKCIYDKILVNNNMIGLIGAQFSESIKPFARLNYWIAQQFTNQGIASESLRLIIDSINRKYKIKNFEILIATNNKASIRVAEKNSFTCIGITKNREMLQGVWVDNYVYRKHYD